MRRTTAVVWSFALIMLLASCAGPEGNEYALAFDANGGTGNMQAVLVAYGESITLPLNAFTREGYLFAGWATSPSTTVQYADGAAFLMRREGATLYARWTPGHNVRFDANGGIGEMPSIFLTEYTSFTLPANGFSRAFHDFQGWAPTPDIPSWGEVPYAVGAEFEMQSWDVTLYARWKIDETGVLGSGQSQYAFFGASAALCGDYAVVGTPFCVASWVDSGAAYVFHRTGPDTWDSGMAILPSALAGGDYFGTQVAIDGDYVIAGASGDDAGASEAGAAYIFRRTGTNSWDAGMKIVADDPASGDGFGARVAISGDWAVVGAPSKGDGRIEAGAAYVFHRTGTNSWIQSAKLILSDAADYDGFGSAVALQGDTLLVVAGRYASTGVGYAFRRTATGSWVQSAMLAAADGAAGDGFGYAMALHGDYAVVGAPGHGGSGAAYVFRRTGGDAWDAGGEITPRTPQASEGFGSAVAIHEGRILVGAPGNDAGGINAGAVYAFGRNGDGSWDAGVRVLPEVSDAYSAFGDSVAVCGSWAIVGARSGGRGTVRVYRD